MFVDFIECRKCINLFNLAPIKERDEHYRVRKNVKRCIGCEQLEKHNKKSKN